MELIETVDENGYKHLQWCINKDDTIGICADPPFLGQLDFDEIEKEIHNALIDKRLINWSEVQKQQQAIAGILNAIIRKKIVFLYRQAEKET